MIRNDCEGCMGIWEGRGDCDKMGSGKYYSTLLMYLKSSLALFIPQSADLRFFPLQLFPQLCFSGFLWQTCSDEHEIP